MGLFGDLDINSVSDDPFDLPVDKYEAVVSKVEIKSNHTSKNNPESVPTTYLVISYTITDGAAESAIGQTVQDWFRIPKDMNDSRGKQSATQALSWIKRRLLMLGVPESRVDSVSPDDLVGIEVYLDVNKSKNGMPSVKDATVRDGVMQNSAQESANPFANA